MNRPGAITADDPLWADPAVEPEPVVEAPARKPRKPRRKVQKKWRIPEDDKREFYARIRECAAAEKKAEEMYARVELRKRKLIGDMLDSGATWVRIARLFGVSRETVARWVRAHREEAPWPRVLFDPVKLALRIRRDDYGDT